MIVVELRVVITAKNDLEADQVIRALADESKPYPQTPMVQITEKSRSLES